MTPFKPDIEGRDGANVSIQAQHQVLTLDDFQDGFKVEKLQSIDAGIGATAHWWYENGTGIKENLTGYFGLIPVKGSSLRTIQFAKDEKSILQLVEIKGPPLKAIDLDFWSAGDSVSYSATGSVVYYAGLGLRPVSFGPTKIAKGEWLVDIKKVGHHSALVKITDAHIESVSIAINQILASLGVSSVDESETKFTFLVDYETQEGKKAYEDLVGGNVKPIQVLASNEKFVKLLEHGDLVKNGRHVNFFFGIPIFANSAYSFGTIATLEKSNFKIDRDSTVDLIYGIFSEEQRNRLLNTHSSRGSVFYGITYRLKESDRSNFSYLGKMVYSFSDDDSTSRSFRFFLADMAKKSGFSSILSFSIPDGQDLNYSRSELQVVFTEDQTDQLIELASSHKKYEFISRGLNLLHTYPLGIDPWNVCDGKSGILNCRDEEQQKVEAYLSDMWSALREMGKYRGNNQLAFAKAYAAFGKTLSESPFLMQAAVQFAGEGVEVAYRLEGTRISRIQRYYSSLPSGELRSDQPPENDLISESPGELRSILNRGILVTPNPGPIFSPINSR